MGPTKKLQLSRLVKVIGRDRFGAVMCRDGACAASPHGISEIRTSALLVQADLVLSLLSSAVHCDSPSPVKVSLRTSWPPPFLLELVNSSLQQLLYRDLYYISKGYLVPSKSPIALPIVRSASVLHMQAAATPPHSAFSVYSDSFHHHATPFRIHALLYPPVCPLYRTCNDLSVSRGSSVMHLNLGLLCFECIPLFRCSRNVHV